MAVIKGPAVSHYRIGRGWRDEMLYLSATGDGVEREIPEGGLCRERFPKRDRQNLINAAERRDDVDDPEMRSTSPFMRGKPADPAVQALMDFICHPGPVDEGERHGAFGKNPALVEHDRGEYGRLYISDQHVFSVFSACH